MKKTNKILISLILLILCTGCTIDYKLEITSDTIKETIEVNDTIMTNRTKQDIYNEYNLWFPVYTEISDTPIEYDANTKLNDVEYHQKSIKENSNGYYYTYKYDYPIKQYKNASVIRQAYENGSVYVADNYITINSGKSNLLCNYSYFESLKVSITIDKDVYTVRKNNAYGINENTYIWELDRNNCNNSGIILILDKINSDELNTTDQDEDAGNKTAQKENSEFSMYIFYGILILIILIVYIMFTKLKNKNTNSIDD